MQPFHILNLGSEVAATCENNFTNPWPPWSAHNAHTRHFNWSHRDVHTWSSNKFELLLKRRYSTLSDSVIQVSTQKPLNVAFPDRTAKALAAVRDYSHFRVHAARGGNGMLGF